VSAPPEHSYVAIAMALRPAPVVKAIVLRRASDPRAGGSERRWTPGRVAKPGAAALSHAL